MWISSQFIFKMVDCSLSALYYSFKSTQENCGKILCHYPNIHSDIILIDLLLFAPNFYDCCIGSNKISSYQKIANNCWNDFFNKNWYECQQNCTMWRNICGCDGKCGAISCCHKLQMLGNFCIQNKTYLPSLIWWVNIRGRGCWRWHTFDHSHLSTANFEGLMEGGNWMASWLVPQGQE